MPDVASLVNDSATGRDPEIVACAAQVDSQVQLIAAAYDNMFATLIKQTNQYISTSQETLRTVTDRLASVAVAAYNQVAATGTTVRDSLAAQTLNTFTELGVTLQASGIPLSQLGQPDILAGGPKGATNAADRIQLANKIRAGFSGSPAFLQESPDGRRAANVGTGIIGEASSGIYPGQSVRTTVAGSDTGKANPGTLTAFSALDRFIVVNRDGTTYAVAPVRNPSSPGIVWLYPVNLPPVNGQPSQLPAPPPVSIVYSGDATTIR